MSNDLVFAPWRIEYLRSLDKGGDDNCFLCECAGAATDEQRRKLLVLWKSAHTLVMMNRFPYTNGHLLLAPLAHKSEPEELTDEEQLDLQRQTVLAIRLLRRGVSAQGFNVGTNLGRCAGAGVPGHLHHHLVPRWSGDVNFISVIGQMRIVPQALTQLYDELLRVRQELGIP